MAAPRGRRSTARRSGEQGREASPSPPSSDASVRVPELLRRALGLGVAGFFSGEEFLRKALGDTVPREWVEFAAAQSDRTRRDFAERLASELGKSLQAIDLQQLAERLLQGHTVEVTASIRFRPRDEHETGSDHDLRVRVAREEKS